MKLLLVDPAGADELGSPTFQEPEIGGVIDDAGKIRVLIIDAQGEAMLGQFKVPIPSGQSHLTL
jgi:hypothetical protein